MMEVQKGLAYVPWRVGALHLLSARAWNCCLMGFSALWPPLSQHPSGGLPCAQWRASHSATQPWRTTRGPANATDLRLAALFGGQARTQWHTSLSGIQADPYATLCSVEQKTRSVIQRISNHRLLQSLANWKGARTSPSRVLNGVEGTPHHSALTIVQTLRVSLEYTLIIISRSMSCLPRF